MKLRYSLIALAVVFGGLQVAWSQEIPRFPDHGWFDFKAPAMQDPALQHAKETFIQYGCAYCHNVDLHPRGEAADLMHSPVVAVDVDGAAISAVLKAGIPQTAKLSPMPQFSDLSDTEMKDIARWIHYARMEGRFGELMAVDDAGKGSVAAGKAYFQATCSACHAVASLRQKLGAVKPQNFKAYVLKPAVLERPVSFAPSPKATGLAEGRARHSALLENYTEKQAADLVAYLRQVR